MRLTLALPIIALIAAGAPEPGFAYEDVQFVGSGYPFKADPCRRVMNDAYTSQFMDESTVLVGCPEDSKNLEAYVNDNSAIEVARHEGYVLYRVPRP